MDEATRSGGTAVNARRSPEEIRRDIERTRRDLGDTVEALSARTDVKAQVEERKRLARAKVDEVRARVTGATPGQAAQIARSNPMPVAAGGAFAAGFLLGRLTKRRG